MHAGKGVADYEWVNDADDMSSLVSATLCRPRLVATFRVRFRTERLETFRLNPLECCFSLLLQYLPTIRRRGGRRISPVVLEYAKFVDRTLLSREWLG